MTGFFDNGWRAFDYDPALAQWAAENLPRARDIAADHSRQDTELRHGKTWFVGINALPNDGDGAVDGGVALTGRGYDWVKHHVSNAPLDAAQISVAYRGYPLQDRREGDANFKFRKDRDAAHVDGILPIGPQKRRYVREPHAYVLGVPLNPVTVGCSPMVIWEGSHLIMRGAFEAAFGDLPPAQWSRVDVTEVYTAARRQCFEECKRVEVFKQPGECYIVHRLALHGIAPWQAKDTTQERIVAYFRPYGAFDLSDWLSAP